MATLRDIRNRILGIKNIEKITSALKMVSSIKVRKAQRLAENARPFFNKTEKMLGEIVYSTDTPYENPLLISKEQSKIKNIIVFIIAGDKGLCGSFNTNLFRTVDNYLTKSFVEKYPNAKPILILIGNKTVEYYSKHKHNFEILKCFNNAFQPLKYDIVTECYNLILDKFINNEADQVEIFYNRFINSMKQEPTYSQLLPLKINIEKLDNKSNLSQKQYTNNYIFEPSKKETADYLVNQYLKLNLWSALLESNASEHSARLAAMDKATQNANDLIKELELQFNNARQNAITTEMLEIISGADSLKNK